VEPDYLLDSEVFFFQSCLYPMKYLHPRSMYTLPRKGVQGGVPPLRGLRGISPRLGGLGASGPPTGAQGKHLPMGVRGRSHGRKNCLVNVLEK
jgi:hypothetical protein